MDVEMNIVYCSLLPIVQFQEVYVRGLKKIIFSMH